MDKQLNIGKTPNITMMFHKTPDLTMVKFETSKTTITAFKVPTSYDNLRKI